MALQEMAAGLLAERADAGAADCGGRHVDVLFLCCVVLYWSGVGCVGARESFLLLLRKSRRRAALNGDLTIELDLSRSQGSQSEGFNAAVGCIVYASRSTELF